MSTRHNNKVHDDECQHCSRQTAQIFDGDERQEFDDDDDSVCIIWHDDAYDDHQDIDRDDMFIRQHYQINQDLHHNITEQHKTHSKPKPIHNEIILKNIGEYIAKLMGWIVNTKVIKVKIINTWMDELIDTTYLETLFAKLDKNNDKQISRDELYESFMEEGGDKFSEPEIKLIINYMDKDDDGNIEFEEFFTMFHYMKIQSMEDLIKSAYLYVLFCKLDLDQSGKIEFIELKRFFIEQSIQLNDDEILRLMDETDLDNDGSIDFYEFYFIFSKVTSFEDMVSTSRLHVIFNSIDTDNSGALEFDEISRLFKQEKIDISDTQLKTMMDKIDENNDGVIDFDEFETAFKEITCINDLVFTWQNLNSIDIGSDLSMGSGLSKLSILPIIAGGCGGIMSRTLTAPLERAKLLAQTGISRGMKKTFIMIIDRQGFWKGLWKGNLYGCLRIFPFAGCVTFTYSIFLKYIVPNKYQHRIENPKDPMTHFWRFCAGMTAGCIATTITYPLDLLKANETIDISITKEFGEKGKNINTTTKIQLFWKRMSIRFSYTSIQANIRQELRENNIKTFKDAFRGLIPTLFAMPMFIGVQNMSYDFLRIYMTSPSYLNIKPSIELFAACGVAAGITAQSIIYPMDVIRRRIQTDTMWTDPTKNAFNTKSQSRHWLNGVINMIRGQGLKPLFAGLLPTYLKVAPSVAISVTTRDIILGRLNVDD